MKFAALIRVLLTLVGLFALATQAQTIKIAVQRDEADNSDPEKSPSDNTARDKPPSETAKMHNPPTLADIEAGFATLHAQLAAQLSHLEAIVAAAQRLDPARAAMKEFSDDMKKSDYLGSRMAELGVESAFTYWKAVYGGVAGDDLLQQWG